MSAPMIARRLGAAGLAAWLALAALPALAHELFVFARADGAQIVVEARFSSGQPAAGGAVRLEDDAGALIAAGAIDPAGRAALALPDAPGGLRVVVLAKGHRGEWVLTPADLAAAAGS